LRRRGSVAGPLLLTFDFQPKKVGVGGLAGPITGEGAG